MPESEEIFKEYGFMGAQGGPPLGSGTNAILCNPWISSAMAMAMSIYRTLCVLVVFVFACRRKVYQIYININRDPVTEKVRESRPLASIDPGEL